MTVATAMTKARRLSRTSISGCSNRELLRHINDAQKEFARKVKNLTREGYVTIAPTFDLQTEFALRLTIVGGANVIVATDIAVCTADAFDQTGTQVATALQAAIRAAITAAGGTPTLTAAWSTTAWTFTLDGIDCTSITITNPSAIIYASALALLGLSAATTTDTSVTGSIPMDSTLESALPTDFIAMVTEPEWDGEPLVNAPMDIFKSPNTQGTPTKYHIRNKRIMLYPPPNRQGNLHLWYEYIPEEFDVVQGYQECGLSGKAFTTTTGLSATTQYYFKVAIDGGAVTEYSITTAALLTYEDVLDLLNAAVKGATFELVDGDLRCSSDTIGALSAAAITAGTTGTNLFATLTGFTAFETAVATEAGDDLHVDDEYAMAVVYKAASQIAEENNETLVRDGCFAQFIRICQDCIVSRANSNTSIFPESRSKPAPEVDFGD